MGQVAALFPNMSLIPPSSVLPEVESSLDNDGFDMTDSQALLSRLQWDGSSDLSPSDSGSSKTSENQGWGLGITCT